MESNTFAGTSARRYRIVDAEERLTLNIKSIVCGLKSIDMNKENNKRI
jgi:hypothetical protein